MTKFLLLGFGLLALGAAWKVERDEDGPAVAYAPLILALALEVGSSSCADINPNC